MSLTEKKLRTDQIFSIISMLVVLILYRSIDRASTPADISFLPSRQILVYSTPIVPIPLFGTGEVGPVVPNLTATAAAVIDLRSKAVLFEKNSHQKLLPASTTKLMTALIVRENYQLDDVITVLNPPIIDGAAIKFYPNESLTVENLLRAMLIQSGNDAAIILAEHYPSGTQGFIDAMNQKAVDLNLNNTHFANVTGFDHEDHYSTAHDLAILSQEVMNDQVLRAIVRQPQTLITDLTGKYNHLIYSTNYLLSRDPEIVGIKTGTTEGAGEVLITQVEKNGSPLLIVVMGSQSRYDDTLELINWAYGQHQWLVFDAILESESASRPQ